MVASKVGAAQGTTHHAQGQAVVGELDLGPADPRRAVLSQRGHGVVLVRGEKLAHPSAEIWFCGGELIPGGHGLTLAGSCDVIERS